MGGLGILYDLIRVFFVNSFQRGLEVLRALIDNII
jgi:hypothetical protein